MINMSAKTIVDFKPFCQLMWQHRDELPHITTHRELRRLLGRYDVNIDTFQMYRQYKSEFRRYLGVAFKDEETDEWKLALNFKERPPYVKLSAVPRRQKNMVIRAEPDWNRQIGSIRLMEWQLDHAKKIWTALR